MDKIPISLPVVVEGKYDQIKLASIIDATILTTEGFGIFNNKEKRALLRALSKNGIILLTDSDGAGGMIRSHLQSFLPPDKIYHLYIPQISGKEKRKKSPSKAGTLGVEGMDAALLREMFQKFADRGEMRHGRRGIITKADFFADGLTGRQGSADKRNALCARLSLPRDMTPTALLAAVNLLLDREEYRAEVESLSVDKAKGTVQNN